MGEQRKPDVDDVRKSSGSLHSGKQVRDPSDIRVAVYSCTAADYEENHKKLYNSDIKNHPHWKITEIYMDKSASGINRAYYEEFSRMMEDARSGKIDYIVSKSAFRFARDLKETLNCVRELRQLVPPVGVYFKKENIDTLDATGEILSSDLIQMNLTEHRQKPFEIRHFSEAARFFVAPFSMASSNS